MVALDPRVSQGLQDLRAPQARPVDQGSQALRVRWALPALLETQAFRET